MVRMALFPAASTGTFCVGFTTMIDIFTGTLKMLTVIAVEFVSGFRGSLFASVVCGADNQLRWRFW